MISILVPQTPPTVNTSTVSGAVVKGNSDYTPDAAQVAHAPKPQKNFANAPIHTINQPRK